MDSTIPPFAELIAPAHWQVLEFISDLHLQSSERAGADSATVLALAS